MIDASPYGDVQDEPEAARFIADDDGVTAELVYRIECRLVLARTHVPLSLDQHRMGGRLLRAAVARARAEQLTLVPSCSFARRWLRDHPDELDGVAIDWSTVPSPAAGCPI